MQILIVVQVQISFIGRFDFLTKPLPIVLDLDQFSDVMCKTTLDHKCTPDPDFHIQ